MFDFDVEKLPQFTAKNVHEKMQNCKVLENLEIFNFNEKSNFRNSEEFTLVNLKILDRQLGGGGGCCGPCFAPKR